MNKGFETLEMLSKDIRYKKEHIRDDLYRLYIKKNEIKLLENYLIELEQIKNAKPSEAMEGVDILYANAMDLTTENTKYLPEYLKPIRDKIKQALLKAQEQEKVLEITWKKPTQSRIAIAYLKTTVNSTYEDYCVTVATKYQLTEEEFDLLKMWSEK